MGPALAPALIIGGGAILKKQHDDHVRRGQTKEMRDRIAAIERRERTLQLDTWKRDLAGVVGKVEDLEKPYLQLYVQVQEAEAGVDAIQARVKAEEKHLRTRFPDETQDDALLRLLLYGVTGNGKSTLGNRIWGDWSELGDEGPFAVGHGAGSVTTQIQKAVARGKHLARHVSVTDIPGTEDTSGADRLNANDLVQYLRGIGHLDAIVLVQTFQSKLTAAQQEQLRALQERLGRGVWKHVVIAFTHADPNMVSSDDVEKYGKDFQSKVRSKLGLTEKEAPLPFVAMDSVTNYKEPVKQLLKQCESMGQFKPKDLKSPLDGLKTQLGIAKAQLRSKQENLQQTRDSVLKLRNQAQQLQENIKGREPGYQMQSLRSFLKQ